MIEKIQISNVASYTNSTILELSKSNFVYGANGSGKTTISRIIATPSSYSYCTINWQSGIPLKTIVYNSDFVRDNFSQSEIVKGVFTLGENRVEIEKQIADAKAEIDKINLKIASKNSLLSEKRIELDQKESEFLEVFWKTEDKYDDSFKNILTGYRNSKQKFKEKVKSEFQARKSNSKPINIDELKSQYKSIFNSDRQLIARISVINIDFSRHEQNPILPKKIIGSQDVAISNLIQELNNSDWVKQGQYYLAQSNNQCPFCQQQISNDLDEKLKKYFDKTFEQDISALESLINSYNNSYQQLKNDIQSLNSPFLNNQEIEIRLNKLDYIFDKNITELNNKKLQPSISISLESVIDIIKEINEVINYANQEIDSHNSIINNIEQEKDNLTNLFWDFLIQEMKLDIERYYSETSSINQAINGLTVALSNEQQRMSKQNTLLNKLEREITSIKPTADAINRLLKSFGFTSFSLKTTEDEKNYRIIRENGVSASETLSEGEKTFITFLYFYQLIKGSHTQSGINQNCVIVIDDPISSLDNDVLFIVSNLIRQLYVDMDTTTSNLKQLIILTHNVYFYKEITFIKKFNKTNYPKKPSYHIVRKIDKSSSITKYEDIPIKTSYELLWQNIREKQYSSATIQNILRKILENYFKILGGINLDSLSEKFIGKDQILCNSLCSWINDGSHFTNDDIFVAIDDESVEKYLDIFRRIFETQGQIAHYNMMINQHN